MMSILRVQRSKFSLSVIFILLSLLYLQLLWSHEHLYDREGSKKLSSRFQRNMRCSPPRLLLDLVSSSEHKNITCDHLQCGRCLEMQGKVLCTPTFILIGAAKAGTSSLYHWMASHPNIVAADRKEQHFWTHRFSLKNRKVQQYLGNFSTLARHLEGKNSPNCDTITGEATPDMHYYPISPYRLSIMLPNVKILFLVRPAFDMAFSMFNYNRGKLSSQKNNAKRFVTLWSVETLIREHKDYSPLGAILWPTSKKTDADMSGPGIFASLNFSTWAKLFALEIDICLRCKYVHTEFAEPECSKIPQLNIKQPALFRWHEDVEMLESKDSNRETTTQLFGGRLLEEDSCFFPPATHHLNFFGRAAYERQLRLYRKFFLDTQMMVIETNTLFSSPQSTLDCIVDFLSLPRFVFSAEALSTKLNGPLRFRPGMDAQTRNPTDHSTATNGDRKLFWHLKHYLDKMAVYEKVIHHPSDTPS